MIKRVWKLQSAFNMTNNSALIAGDGAKNSTAYIKFNGGTLNEYDNSYVSILNNNNYYYNYSNYNSRGVSIKTKENTLNCGTSGKNDCSAPIVYGPVVLNFAGMASSATLPVKLSAFSVKLNGSAVAIAWTTDMELNSDRFEIEKSTDGVNWKTVGTVKSHGNSSVVNKYSFSDVVKTTGSINYRLKMVDIDEAFEYSAIKSVKAEVAHEMSIYPNPATDYVVINSKNSNDKVNVQLINYNGQVLKQVNGGAKVSLSVNEFKAGNYVVKVSDTNGVAQSFKLMITK